MVTAMTGAAADLASMQLPELWILFASGMAMAMLAVRRGRQTATVYA